MLQNYFKIAIRNLQRNKVFSLINIAGLSIGLACCMLIVLYTKDEISYDRFHKNVNQIYRITSTETAPDGKVQKFGITGMMPGPAFKAQLPEIENYVRLQGESYNIKKGNDILVQDALKVDSSFFSIFTFDFIEGSPKTALKDPQSVVISEEVAEKYFGEESALGKTLAINYDDTFQPFTVAGVTKKSPQNSSIKIDLLMPFHREKNHDDQWINFYLNTFVTLKPLANPKALEAKFANIYAREAKGQLIEAKEKWNFQNTIQYGLQPFLEVHLSTDFRAANGLKDESNPMYSYVLIGLAVFLLLIACINFVNLTVARSVKRSKEIGIRKVVGGDRKQLIFQFMGESFVLSLIAFLLAIVLVELTLPIFNTLANKALSLKYLFDAQLITSYFLLFLLTGFLAGIYPALILSSFSPVDTLYGRFKLSKGSFLQKSLVVFQFSLAAFMMMATLILYAQFDFMVKQDLGYNDKNIVEIATGRMNRTETNTFKQELLKNPTIENVAPRQGGTWNTLANVNGKKEIIFAIDIVDEDYLSTLKIPMVQGRNFSKDFPSDSSQSILVNEAFVKEAGWKNPIGQTVDFFSRNRKFQVVGVVKDYHYNSLYETIKPQLFTCHPDMGTFAQLSIKIKPTNTPNSLKFIEKTFKNLRPTQPYIYDFKDQSNQKQYEKEAKWKQIISFSAILIIFISCIGLFGLATLSAEKRTKEIGIRKVLGANALAIVSMLTKDFLKLVLASVVFAFPLAWWSANKFLESYPYRIAIDGWMFALVLVILVLITILTISYQALKSALANPVKSLRTE
ncbi:ABC transporter permease [Arcicella lustrica]|uniref:ABC transporter permease n=1 Tax=Arcicella lustrica TaxID=2984196 RepID=A0ABU5SIT7_9BACT|nr:ABC transporter permease [Arcicella sp. DC25W]MEA5427181.1 ABC transporter permease [Arcicella sp. DC25W]